MKITVLGSSHGNPTQEAFQTSVLLEEKGKFYLLDAGDGAATLLIRQKVDPSALSALFITHFHLDHTASLPLLLHLGQKHRSLYPQILPEIFLPEYGKKELLQGICELNHVAMPLKVRFRDMRKEFFEDGSLSVHFIPTCHIAPDPESGSCSFAVWVQTEGSRVLFTGDLKGDFSDFPMEAASRSDVLFCELTHFDPEKALETFRILPLKKLIFYHLHDPYQTPEGRKKILQLCQNFPFEVITGFDSLTLTL